jgi:hypothetical protein
MEHSLERKLDRQAVRKLAEKHSSELQKVANAGGNHYQVSLDQNDKVMEYAQSLSSEDHIAFLNMYAEELNAITSKKNDNANKLIAQQNSPGCLINIALPILALLFLAALFDSFP